MCETVLIGCVLPNPNRRRSQREAGHITQARLVQVAGRLQTRDWKKDSEGSTKNLGDNVHCGEENLVIHRLNQWYSGVT